MTINRDWQTLLRFPLKGFGEVIAQRPWGDSGEPRQVRLSWNEKGVEVYMLIPVPVFSAITSKRHE